MSSQDQDQDEEKPVGSDCCWQALEGFSQAKIRCLRSEVKLPRRATDGAAGYDLYSVDPIRLKAGEPWLRVDLGFQLQIPEDCYGQISPRSGLARHHEVEVFPAIIDASSKSRPLYALLRRFACPAFADQQDVFEIPAASRIAQLVFQDLVKVKLEQAEELARTKRQEHGFGSTGTQ